MPLTSPRGRRAAALVVLAVIVLGLTELTYSVSVLESSLGDTAAGLEEATEHIEDLRFDEARQELDVALDAARSAQGAADRPLLSLGSHLPLLGRDVRSLEVLAEVAHLSASAGIDAMEAVESTGLPQGGFSALLSRSELNVDSIEGMRPHLQEALGHLRQALEVLDGTDRPVLSLVHERMELARSSVTAGIARVGAAERILAAIPGLVGDATPRRYFLALQGPNEARGTGGLIGLYGLVSAEDGRLRLAHVAPIEDLVPRLREPVTAPRWFRHLYGPLAAVEQWEQANASPNFPVVSRVLLRMYEASTGERLDGVISMDPVALGHILRATGPLAVEGMRDPVGADNAARVLLHDSYFAFAPDQTARDAYLLRLMDAIWEGLRAPETDADALMRGVVRSARTRHLAVFSSQWREQSALRRLGVDGGFKDLGPNVQLVFHNNAAANKVDYFLRRSIHTGVRLLPSGDASVSTRLVVRNTAPKGPPSYFLGPGMEGDPPGMNRMLLGFVIPRGSKRLSLSVDGRLRRPFRGEDEGLPVLWDVVEVRAGRSRLVTVRYEIPTAWDTSSDHSSFTMTLVPQALAQPDDFSLTITPPDAFSVTEMGERTRDESGSFGARGRLQSVRPFTVEMSRR